MKGKRYKQNKTKIKHRLITRLICLLVLVPIFILSVSKILTWLNENKENDKIMDLISNTITIDEKEDKEEKYNVDFAKLKETNPDTIAWLKVNGTDIDYPVVKTDNNDYYLIKNMRIS